jgi:hypothetical protein
LVKIKDGIPYSAISSKELPSWFTENLKGITKGVIDAEGNDVA